MGPLHCLSLTWKFTRKYDYIWCLVVSGAGANVARKDHFPQSVHCNAPALSLTVANGVHMPNSGARRVVTFSKDGTRVERIFYEADVEMLSLRWRNCQMKEKEALKFVSAGEMNTLRMLTLVGDVSL